jgi:hypothetical protein
MCCINSARALCRKVSCAVLCGGAYVSSVIQTGVGVHTSVDSHHFCVWRVRAEIAAVLRLTSADSYLYLNPALLNPTGAAAVSSSNASLAADGIDDSAQFTVLVEALNSIGIGAEQQLQLFRVLSGILHLGNLRFHPLTADSCELDKKPLSENENAVSCDDHLLIAADLFGVPAHALAARLLTRNITVPGSSVITKPLSVSDAQTNRDTICKTLYNSIFGWLVRVMNKKLLPASTKDKEMLWIGYVVTVWQRVP